jgi:hypothetical protein
MVEKVADDKVTGPAESPTRSDPNQHPHETLSQGDTYTIDGAKEVSVIDGVDPIYAAKARVLNAAIQEIGMGRYQWQLFFVIGFGWAQDNLWPVSCISRRIRLVLISNR